MTVQFSERVIESIGLRSSSAYEIVGQGAVNHVVVHDTNDGLKVVRFHLDPKDTDTYEKEEWCLRNAKAAGIPTPEFVARGTLDGRAYIIQDFVQGVNGDQRRSPSLWSTLGKYGELIAQIDLSSAPDSLFPRFGRDLESNWRQHIDYNLAELTSTDPLLALNVYDECHQPEMRQRFSKLRDSVGCFGLRHGDLVPKNTIVTPDGEVVLLDWGSAYAGEIPYGDLLRIKFGLPTEAFTDEDLGHFAKGRGVCLQQAEPVLNDLRLLNAIDVVRWSIDQRPDLLDSYVAKGRQTVRDILGP